VAAFGDAALPAGLSNVIAISASSGISGQDLALKRDGTVVVWNFRQSEVLPTPSELTNVVRVAAGWRHNLALTKDGRVFGWGANGSGQATGVANTNLPYEGSGFVTIAGEMLTNVVEIAAADSYSLVLKADGSILVWGRPCRSTDEWSIPTGLSNVVAIAAGSKFCLAITTNAAVAERFRR
jgi:alpha-tubulin suppressor-like RCC1 family protein